MLLIQPAVRRPGVDTETPIDTNKRHRNTSMRIEYDRDTCIGMFQCTAEWDAFEADTTAGKAVLTDATETEDGLFIRPVPEDAELDAKFAARSCPVDAIVVYDDDGNQLVP